MTLHENACRMVWVGSVAPTNVSMNWRWSSCSIYVVFLSHIGDAAWPYTAILCLTEVAVYVLVCASTLETMESTTKSLAVVGRTGWYMRWLMRTKLANSSTNSPSGRRGRGEGRERRGEGRGGRGGRDRGGETGGEGE